MDKPVRKSPRIPEYDYSKDNYYFVTICTQNKKCLFGRVNEFSRYGKIAADSVMHIPLHYSGVKIDKFVVMPNHIHMILILEQGAVINAEQVIGQYKSGVSREIRKIDPEFVLWQRSFHDHIIRNQKQYEKIWMYIENNPLRWEKDCFYIE